MVSSQQTSSKTRGRGPDRLTSRHATNSAGVLSALTLQPRQPIWGVWVALTGTALSFSFNGLVIASLIYSLPFMVQPLTAAFGQIGKNPMEAASMLGASPWNAWRTTVLPMTRNGYLTAAVLTFAHTVGEFGIVLMVGGNLAGETRVISIAIYESVETLDYEQAHLLSVGLLIFFFFDPALCLLFQSPVCFKPWAKERKLVLCIDIQARQGDLSLQVNTRIANTVTALAGPERQR